MQLHALRIPQPPFFSSFIIDSRPHRFVRNVVSINMGLNIKERLKRKRKRERENRWRLE
jgi:hypothetical protein